MYIKERQAYSIVTLFFMLLNPVGSCHIEVLPLLCRVPLPTILGTKGVHTCWCTRTRSSCVEQAQPWASKERDTRKNLNLSCFWLIKINARKSTSAFTGTFMASPIMIQISPNVFTADIYVFAGMHFRFPDHEIRVVRA